MLVSSGILPLQVENEEYGVSHRVGEDLSD